MNQKERDEEIARLSFEINHLKLKLEKDIQKYTKKIKEPRGLLSCLSFGYYDRKIEYTEQWIQRLKELEMRMEKIIKDESR